MKRYFVPPFLDFDARVHALTLEIRDDWEESVKAQHRQNRENMLVRLREEFGSQDFDQRLQNFTELGDAPFSIISYHNAFFRQCRNAFVIGSYFPALAGACALGERILNHLVIDLRDLFKATPQYKTVYRKGSFDNWGQAISVLEAWAVIQGNVPGQFRKLAALRHSSIHFEQSTYVSVRRDALAALEHLRAIIREQFGAFGTHRWFIEGTSGVCFIKKDFESDPFVRAFYLPKSLCVGPLHAVSFQYGGVMVFDRTDYDDREVSDEEFRDLYNNRDLAALASTELPPAPDVKAFKLNM